MQFARDLPVFEFPVEPPSGRWRPSKSSGKMSTLSCCQYGVTRHLLHELLHSIHHSWLTYYSSLKLPLERPRGIRSDAKSIACIVGTKELA
jgi:hypothetical protein